MDPSSKTALSHFTDMVMSVWFNILAVWVSGNTLVTLVTIKDLLYVRPIYYCDG